MPLTIYQHFATYENLPVRVNDIADFLIGRGVVQRILFHEVDLNVEVIQGFLVVYEEAVGYAKHICADVYYSKHLSPDEKRLVIVKELLHIDDAANEVCNDPQQVVRLLTEVPWPADMFAQLGDPAKKDSNGLAYAAAVLLPSGAREQILPLVPSKVSLDNIASIAELPEYVVRVVLSKRWEGFLSDLEKGKV